jgi:HEAT repeat protein
VRAAAALSLAVVEPGEPADEALRRALDDPVPEVQRAARAALAWRARARAS